MTSWVSRNLVAKVEIDDTPRPTLAPGAGQQFRARLSAWEHQALGRVKMGSLKGFLGLGVAN
jgi:hypothetical protein